MAQKPTYPYGGAIRTAVFFATVPLIGAVYVPIIWTWHHFFAQFNWPLVVTLAYITAITVLAIIIKIARLSGVRKTNT